MSENLTNHDYGSDVKVLNIDGREFILVGTAHVSKKSADLVREVIEKEKPDTVCVELDEKRFKALSEQKKWESLDLKTVIKEKQLSTLMINILLASYQKRMGEKLGVSPGAELLEATKVAKENNLPIELCDRDVRITLRRAWKSMSFWQKLKFMSSGIFSVFDKEEITEEKLTEIKEKDTLNELMSELGKAMPVLKRVLIDERDSYLAQKMKAASGKKIVSIVGAGHVDGMVKLLEAGTEIDLSEVEKIPKAGSWFKIFGYGLPAVILGAIAYIGYSKGLGEAGDNLIFWILANGIPSAIGALAALGHPLTILSAFLGAPITSLSPVIGAGYVAAFVQVYFAPPTVKEFQTVIDEIAEFKNWWSNKLLRVLLVFILSGLGSALGTYVGAYEIIKNTF